MQSFTSENLFSIISPNHIYIYVFIPSHFALNGTYLKVHIEYIIQKAKKIKSTFSITFLIFAWCETRARYISIVEEERKGKL